MRVFRTIFMAAILLAPLGATASFAQSSDDKWAMQMAERYPMVRTDITYHTANNYESKLDVYMARGDKPRPTLIYIHGGGWLPGFTKGNFPFEMLPFLRRGWNVVNVDYRPASISLAPAAVQDCLCALKWIARNAKQYNFDMTQLVVMGHSAGGHLALTTGLIPARGGLAGPCGTDDIMNPNADPIKVAAVVNWFGITDVADIAPGAPNEQSYAVMWLGNQANRMEIAKQASPLTYVRAGLPPVISIHGDKDPVVPHSHAVRLHEALNKAKVTNKLITMPGGGHGGFGVDATLKAYADVFDFLGKAGVNIAPEAVR